MIYFTIVSSRPASAHVPTGAPAVTNASTLGICMLPIMEISSANKMIRVGVDPGRLSQSQESDDTLLLSAGGLSTSDFCTLRRWEQRSLHYTFNIRIDQRFDRALQSALPQILASGELTLFDAEDVDGIKRQAMGTLEAFSFIERLRAGGDHSVWTLT